MNSNTSAISNENTLNDKVQDNKNYAESFLKHLNSVNNNSNNNHNNGFNNTQNNLLNGKMKIKHRNSFLLRLINENKNLIEENSDLSDSESENIGSLSNVNSRKNSFGNELTSNIADNAINNDLSKNFSSKRNNILGQAYIYSKFQQKKELNPSTNINKKVLILYTGGTFGMEKSEFGLRPKANFLLNYMFNHSNFCDKEYTIRYYQAEGDESKNFNLEKDFLITPETLIGNRIFYKIFEFETIIDSSNMNMEYWKKIGRSIEKFYYEYDSFIILHGTDTMNYTASILSFMLENLNKLVILTGSQIPLIEMRNDAQKNLIDALTIAGTYDIPEVCLFFDSKLFRGNRTIKNDNINLDAFESPNLPPLVKVGINIKIDWELVRPKCNERFNYFEVLKFPKIFFYFFLI